MRHHFGRPDPILLFAMLVLTGCQGREAPIESYTVKKHAAIQVEIETEATRPMEDASHQLLGAVVLDKEIAWFLKSISPLAKVSPQAVDQFAELLKGLRLEDPSKPTWTLRESWEELPGAGMRVANLKFGEMEFAVSKLPIRRDTDRRRYVLENINRWRKQVQRLPISDGQLRSNAEEFTTADGHDVTLVNVEGKWDAAAMPGGRGSFAPDPMAGGQTEASKPFAYVAPDHWKEQKPGMMQVALFLTGDGQASAEISVSQLGGAAGGVLANVNRWRRQVGLKPLKEDGEVNPEPLRIAGNDSVLLTFRGNAGKSILVAMVPSGGSVWFFKLMGDSSIVDQETDDFREFLNSVQLK